MPQSCLLTAVFRRVVERFFLILLLTVTATVLARAQFCAIPGFTGPTTTLSGTVNTYYAGVTAGASGTTVNRVATAVGAAAGIVVGDMVLIIQMQGANINTSDTSQYGDGLGAANARQDATVPTLPAPSPTVAYTAGTNANATDGCAGGHNASFTAGQYEYAVVTQVASSTQLRVRGAGGGGNLLYSYTQSAATNARSYQVIRVPQLSSATLSATVTAPAWNGATGGVVALAVAGQLTLAAGIDVSQRGFRGGGVRNIAAQTAPQFGGYRAALATNLGGMKGEGYVGTPART